MADGCKHRWDAVWPLPSFHLAPCWKLVPQTVTSAIYLYHCAQGLEPVWGGGFLRAEGLQQIRGLRARDNTRAFDGARACSVGEQKHLCLKEISAAESIC